MLKRQDQKKAKPQACIKKNACSAEIKDNTTEECNNVDKEKKEKRYEMIHFL